MGSTCCNDVGVEWCDELQHDCEFDACIGADNNVAKIYEEVEELFISVVLKECESESIPPMGWNPNNYIQFQTKHPTNSPTSDPTIVPTELPTTDSPTDYPSVTPSSDPSYDPTTSPSKNPSERPSNFPTESPSFEPTNNPTFIPSFIPTINPTNSSNSSVIVAAFGATGAEAGLGDRLWLILIAAILLLLCCLITSYILYKRHQRKQKFK